ncbi:TPA: FAD-binding protein [Photobacterium damselae]
MQQQLAVTKIHETEVLVIGSGIAGLVSCFNLLQHGCQTVLTTDKKLAGGGQAFLLLKEVWVYKLLIMMHKISNYLKKI